MRTLLLILLSSLSCLANAQSVAPDAMTEIRYCGAPERYANGRIKRNHTVLVVFEHLHPCPAPNHPPGACPGWAMDHIIPLACGGCDAVWNLQWLPLEIKSCAGTTCKDRFERKIYCDRQF